MIILCPDIVENRLVSEASNIAWESTRVAEIKNDYERKEVANKLAMESAKCTLNLIRSAREDIALETGMTTIYLFLIGEHYGQVISCSEALKDMIKDTRFEDDLEYYIKTAQSNMKNPDLSKKGGRLTALYTLILEKGTLGTTEAMREMVRKFQKNLSNPTINSYSKILHQERRAYRLGGPTGYHIEMFINQSISLSRKINYGKTAFFEGRLVERGPKMFKRLWEQTYGHKRVFEIENGNDPRTFAILDFESRYGRDRRTRGERFIESGLGVLGELHPLSDMPRFGFRPLKDIRTADFLANCTVRVRHGG